MSDEGNEQNRPEAAMAVFSGQTPGKTIQFLTDEDCLVGTLYLGPPMTFLGDADESARVFFEQVIQRYGNYAEEAGQ